MISMHTSICINKQIKDAYICVCLCVYDTCVCTCIKMYGHTGILMLKLLFQPNVYMYAYRPK